MCSKSTLFVVENRIAALVLIRGKGLRGIESCNECNELLCAGRGGDKGIKKESVFNMMKCARRSLFLPRTMVASPPQKVVEINGPRSKRRKEELDLSSTDSAAVAVLPGAKLIASLT